MPDGVTRGVRKVIDECARVKKGERTLIITDHGIDSLVSTAPLEASHEVGSEAVVAIIVLHKHETQSL